ncbi:MAG: Uma2 family endonuclease [Leptolyngbyaceae bacterium]|nr:Uma2 family endonuclease [Leptolyngbyaceae bacterium]
MVQAPIISQVLYPDSDGKPMAENTVQYDWIVRLVSNLKWLLKDTTAFVAGDLLWYPVKVDAPPVPSQAPDAMVALGRPAGDRGSYKQWEEGDIAPQVVFEILSPSNTSGEMLTKQAFYSRYGVLEMYFYDPDSYDFWGLVRDAADHDFTPVTPLDFPWTSPLLNIRFEMFEDGLDVFHPNGDRFKSYDEVQQERDQVQQERDQIQQERDQIQQERDQIQQERDRALAKLRELGIDPNQL